MNVTAPAESPEHLNQLMIDAIAAAQPVGTSDPRVLTAIRAVPRHAFVPGADLADAYNPDLAVITKRGTAGTALSCASVPYLVAAMLEQLDVRDGHRVFEAGAGTGWNAALLATLAANPWQLIACRALMGAGGALLMPSTLSLLFTVFPPEERGKAVGTWVGVAAGGGAEENAGSAAAGGMHISPTSAVPKRSWQASMKRSALTLKPKVNSTLCSCQPSR